MYQTAVLSLLILFSVSSFAQERIFYEFKKLDSSADQLNEILARGDLFGMGITALGDLDGDFVTELVVASPGKNQLWILFMEKNGNIREAKQLNLAVENLDSRITDGGRFGSRLEALGDWDDDGVPDLLVAEPKAKLGVIEYGAFWMVLLNRDGTVKSATQYSGRTPGLVRELPKDQVFGADIATLDDLDGDGVREIAVGLPMDPAKGTGEVRILFMNKAGNIRKVTRIANESGGFLGELKRGDNFGISVESLGDLDQDGVGDMAVGAMMDDEGGFNQGAVWMLFLNEDGTVKSHQKIITNINGFTGYLDFDDRFGVSLAKLGDMNGDSIPDLAVGALQDDDGGKDKGAVYVLYLNRDGTVIDNHKISETSRNFEGTFEQKYQWAWSVSPLGDLNGDGRNDLIVSGEADGEARGSAWLLFPAEFPERLLEKGTWAEGAGTFSAEDSAMLYKGARTAEDSARVDSMYDLSGYAPNNLVFLLDVSASMRKPTRLPVLRDAFIRLLTYMRPEDKISVITYSGKPSVELSGIPASEQGQIIKTLEEMTSSGDTRPDKAIKVAYELARSHFIEGGNNRIIFATDGGFDLGLLDKSLEKLPAADLPLSVFYFGKLSAFKIAEMDDIARRTFGNSAHITSGSVNHALLREIKQIRIKEADKDGE